MLGTELTQTELDDFKDLLESYMTQTRSDGPVAGTVFDVTTGERKYLTSVDYQYFKWYTSSAEADDYDGGGY